MDKLLETIDEIKTLIPDAKYMTLMESLSEVNKQVPTEYKKLLLNAAQFLIQKLRLNKFEYILRQKYDDYCLTARFPMLSCPPLGLDYLDKIICQDPRHQRPVPTKMYPEFTLSCSTFASCGDGPHYYRVAYSSVATTRTTEGWETPQEAKTYFDLNFVLSLDKHRCSCELEGDDCLTSMSDINKMGNNVMLKFISKMMAFSSSSQTVWPYREELQHDDDEDED